MAKRSVDFKKVRTLFKTRKKCDFIPEYDTYRFLPSELAQCLLTGAGIVFLLSYVFFDSFLLGVLFLFPAELVYLRRTYQQKIKRRKKLLEKQFLTAGSLLGDYLRSGYSVESAVQASMGELTELWGNQSDIVQEWRQMSYGLSLNHPVEEIFQEFGRRSGVDEIREFGEIFVIVKRSGGQLSEVIREKMQILQDSFSVEEQIENMITAKRFEQRIMDIMPLAIVLYIRFSSPELLKVLYTTLTGRMVMTVCLVLYGVAYIWAEKIVEIEV